MDSRQERDAPPQELVPGHDGILDEFRLELTAWCEARPAVMDEYYDAPSQAPPSPEIVLWRAKKGVIRSAFLHRQQLLRARALELSRDRLRPLKFTDLPPEILRIIFDQFQYGSVANPGMWDRDVAWGCYFQDRRFGRGHDRQSTVCRLRLVCRLFCELTTPLLFPILHVHLSQASLDFVEIISKNRAFAAGVRGIHVSLAYRPKEYANSLVRYMDTRLAALQKLERYYNYEIGRHRYRGPEEEEDEDETTKDMRQALDNCRRLRDEWRQYVRAVGRGERPREHLPEYQEILRKGHAEFRRLHQEQWQLLQNGTFSNALASAVARMPNARSFAFVDEVDPGAGYDEDLCLNSTEMLSRFMTTPLTWQDAENVRGEAGGCELPCVRLLWELPIALHRADVTITELKIDSFPLRGNFAMLCAHDQTGAPAWDELSAAYAELEVFDLYLSRGIWLHRNYSPKNNKAHIDKFLGAILARCGRRLRVLELNLRGLAISSGTGPRDDGPFYDAHPIVTQLQELPRLCSLRLSDIGLQEKALHGLCSAVGRHLRLAHMFNIRLRNGLWADTFDVLRQKLLGRGLNAPRHAWYGNLHGGEFDAVPSRASTPSDAGDSPITSYRRDGPLLEDLGQYVRGNLDHNPLRDSNRPWEMSLDVCTCAYGARYPCIMHL